MATSLFLLDAASTRRSSTWSAAAVVYKQLRLTRGALGTALTDATFASLAAVPASAGGAIVGIRGTATTPVASPEAWAHGELIWITEPLNAVTLSSTMTCNMYAAESNAMANYAMQGTIYVIPAGGGAATKIFGSGVNTELAVNAIEQLYTFSLSLSATVHAGDMLAYVPAYGSGGASTSASGFTAIFGYNGATGGTTDDTFLSITETITEQAAAPFDGQQGALHSDPNSLQSIGQAVKRGAFFCLGEKWARKGRLWIPAADRPFAVA